VAALFPQHARAIHTAGLSSSTVNRRSTFRDNILILAGISAHAFKGTQGPKAHNLQDTIRTHHGCPAEQLSARIAPITCPEFRLDSRAGGQ